MIDNDNYYAVTIKEGNNMHTTKHIYECNLVEFSRDWNVVYFKHKFDNNADQILMIIPVSNILYIENLKKD